MSSSIVPSIFTVSVETSDSSLVLNDIYWNQDHKSEFIDHEDDSVTQLAVLPV
jgi:hypothetical protein